MNGRPGYSTASAWPRLGSVSHAINVMLEAKVLSSFVHAVLLSLSIDYLWFKGSNHFLLCMSHFQTYIIPCIMSGNGTITCRSQRTGQPTLGTSLTYTFIHVEEVKRTPLKLWRTLHVVPHSLFAWS